MKTPAFTAAFIILFCTCSSAQQVPDTAFAYPVPKPEYKKGTGPVVVLDEAHSNFHTLGGRYQAFGKVLAADGYQVKPGNSKFTEDYLKDIHILVIANALNDSAVNWNLPVQSAFSDAEIAAIEKYIFNGGSLFLIADHMPFAGAAAKLASVFGFNLINGYALRSDNETELFSYERKNLLAHDIVKGRNKSEKIDSLVLFTGSALLPPANAETLTLLTEAYEIMMPAIAGDINDTTPSLKGRYFANSATLKYGKGRLVLFGEAAAFTAQLSGTPPEPIGMNAPKARQNPQLLLNIIHWLDKKY